METQDKNVIELMRKTGTDSVPSVFDTNSAYMFSQRLDSSKAKNFLAQNFD